MADAVEFDQVEKAYGSRKVLHGLDLKVKRGRVTSLLGTNGAGKTTAILMMLNLLKPGAGRIRVFGMEPASKELRQRVGALLQEVKAADGLRVGEVLRLFRSYYRNPLPYERLLALSGLHMDENRRASSLSGGQRRRLAFAQCMAGNPDLIVLDEPTSGMDVASRIRFWDVIQALAADGKTILLTTHHLEEADAVSDTIAVLMNGKIAAAGAPAELKAELSHRTVSFRITGGIAAEESGGAASPWTDRFLRWPGVEKAEYDGVRVTLYAKETDALLARLMTDDLRVSDIEVGSATLESAFRQITERGELS